MSIDDGWRGASMSWKGWMVGGWMGAREKETKDEEQPLNTSERGSDVSDVMFEISHCI